MMAVKVFPRLSGLEDHEQPEPFPIDIGAKWTGIQQLLASFYGDDIRPECLDVRYWDEEDFVILSSQEELEEAIRLAQDSTYLQLLVRLMDTDSCSVIHREKTSSSLDDIQGEEESQKIASQAQNQDRDTKITAWDVLESTLDIPRQQAALDVEGAAGMDSDEETIDGLSVKALKRALKLHEDRTTTSDTTPTEKDVLDCLQTLEELTGRNPEAGASQPDMRDFQMTATEVARKLDLANQMVQMLTADTEEQEDSEHEPTMMPGALSGANAIAIEMPEMEHHGTEAAEPAEMAETGEVSAKSSRDAETGFWMQPQLEAEVSAELRRRLSTLMAEKERAQSLEQLRKLEERASRRDKKKKHRVAETTSEDTVSQKKGRSSSSSHTSNSLLDSAVKEESSWDSLIPVVQPSKKHERSKSSHKSDNKKKKHSTDPLTEDYFVRYMSKFEAHLKKDVAKEVAKKTMRSVIKNLPKQSDGSDNSNSLALLSTKGAGWVHEDIICDCCDREIVGTRYICGNCPNYDLCEECEDIQPSFHDRTHVFLKLRRPCLKAGTKHGVRVPLLKKIIFDSKGEERKVDPERLQVIMERIKGQEGQSRNNNSEDGAEGEDMMGDQPSPQAEEHRDCLVDIFEADTCGCMDEPSLVATKMSMTLPLDLTRKTDPFENLQMSETEDSPQDCVSCREEDAEDFTTDLLLDDGFVMCSTVQTSDEKAEAGTEEKAVEETGSGAVSSSSSIEVVSQSPKLPQAQAAEPQATAQTPQEPLIPAEVSKMKELQEMSLPSFKEWLDQNRLPVQEEVQKSVGGSSFASLSDAGSSDDEFVVITPDCFDTSKPLNPNRLSELSKKVQMWNATRLKHKDQASSSKEEEAPHYELQAQEEKENSGNDTPALSAQILLPIKAPSVKSAEHSREPSLVEALLMNGAAGSSQTVLVQHMPPCSSAWKKAEKEEEEKEDTAAGQVKPKQTEVVSKSTPERKEWPIEEASRKEETSAGQKKSSVGEPAEEEEEETDGDTNTEETDVKHAPQSEEEGTAAAAFDDSLDPNQQLNQMMTNTLKKASSGLTTLFQTGRDIFRTLQRGDSYEFKESDYEFKPSDYKMPQSTWQPSKDEYIPPKSNFTPVKSEFEMPKSTYTGPKQQVPAGVYAGEYAGPLQRIREMGYYNNERILDLLRKHHGDVQKVVNEMLEETDNDWAQQRHGADSA